MKNAPKISVIIPTYNAEKYLAECLVSIRKQNYPNLELIIMDGGSKDNTRKIVEEYKDIVTTYVSEKDEGQPDAVNKGLHKASGDIIHWHAADDIVMPGAFDKVASEFQSNPDVDLVFSDGLAFDDNNLYRHSTVRWVNFWDALLFFGRFQSDCAYWRRSITEQALPLDNTKPMTCDEDFFLRMWVGRNFKWIAHNLGAFRSHGDQISQRLPKNDVEEQRAATRERICREQGWEETMLDKMRRERRFKYMLQNIMFVKLHAMSRFFLRKISFDIHRKKYSNWFFQSWIGS